MSIAPQNIMSQLRGMDDPELAKYAQMHQQDPYIFPLAFQESQNRQHVRLAKQAQMAGQQQPKVVQQDLAQMAQMSVPQMPPQQMAQQQLPENSGIGQLPAQNMQNMADGGIVGYAEGGEIPRFNGTTGSVPSSSMFDIFNMSKDDAKAYAQMLKEQRAAAANAPTAAPLTANASGFFSELARNARRGLRSLPAVDLASNLFMTSPEEVAILKKAEALKNNVASIPQSTISGTASAADVDSAVGLPPETPVGAGPGAKPPAPPAANLYQLPPSLLGNAGGQGIKTPAPAGLPSVEAEFNKLMGVLPKEKTVEAENIFTEKRLAPYAEFDKKATGMIDKQKDQLKTDKEQEFYMSLIEGGLAAASEGGPNAIQNIAKGFSKGVGRYGEALKDFRKASQENSKMELELTKAQADRKVGNMDKYQERVDKADEHNKALSIAKMSGLSTLLGQDIHGKYQLASTAMQEQGRLASTDLSGRYSVMAHGMPTGVERMVNQMPGDTFADKLKGYSGIMGADARGDTALLQKYMGMSIAEKAQLKQNNPQLASLLDMQLQTALLKPTNKPSGPIRE